MQIISSTMIKGVEYSRAQKRLRVFFNLKDGQHSEYLFEGVPRSIADRLRRSDSKGKFFNSHIKNKFKFKKL